MQALKLIPRTLLAALLLVLQLCPGQAGAEAQRALVRHEGAALAQRPGLRAGDAVLQTALPGATTAFRRGDEGSPHGPGAPSGAGVLPDPLPPLQAYRAGRGQTRQIPPVPDFIRVQVKLLFPKHWFW